MHHTSGNRRSGDTTTMNKIILFVLCSCAAFAQGAKPTGAWLPVRVTWEHAPESVNPKLETAATTVLYFDEQRRFALVRCVVNRESGQYTVSHGDGQVVYLGEWDGRLPGEVKYRLVSRTVSLKGETLPGPWHEEKLASASKTYLQFEGKLYRRVEALDPSVREIVHGLAAMSSMGLEYIKQTAAFAGV